MIKFIECVIHKTFKICVLTIRCERLLENRNDGGIIQTINVGLR